MVNYELRMGQTGAPSACLVINSIEATASTSLYSAVTLSNHEARQPLHGFDVIGP